MSLSCLDWASWIHFVILKRATITRSLICTSLTVLSNHHHLLTHYPLLPNLPFKSLPSSHFPLLHLLICSSEPHLNKISWEFPPIQLTVQVMFELLLPSAYSSVLLSLSTVLSLSLSLVLHPLSVGNYMLLIHQLRISVHHFSVPLGAVTSYD